MKSYREGKEENVSYIDIHSRRGQKGVVCCQSRDSNKTGGRRRIAEPEAETKQGTVGSHPEKKKKRK